MPLKRVMTLARLASGAWVVHNAIALDERSMAQIDALGGVAHLVVPNGWHRQDLRVFHERYPRATVLAPRGALAPLDTGMLALRRELQAIRRAHGGTWPRLEELSHAERQRLNGRLGAGLELLAKVPHALETQYAPKVPELRP